jgi:branched-subunit amino acid ABC-type transport system permease component
MPSRSRPAVCPVPPRPIRQELLTIMGAAPPTVRRAMCDLMRSIKAGLDAGGKTPSFVDGRAKVFDWRSLLPMLTDARVKLDQSVAARLRRRGKAKQALAHMERQFATMRRSHEELTLTVEIIYALINVGGGVSVTNLKVIVIVVSILVFLFLQTIVTKTKIGMAMRGISYDKFAIPLMGIPLDTIIVFTFILGSSMAGLAGILFAMSYPILEPYMGALIGWKAFIAAVVGGIGDIRGAIVGGFLLGFIEIGVVAVFPSTLRDLFAFSVLLIILWLRPTGIFGVAQTTKI